MTKEEAEEGPISREEMRALFGEEMPMEAVQLLWGAGPDETIGSVRAKLRALAKERPRVIAMPTREEADELRRGFVRRSTEILISLAEKNATLPAAIQNDYAARAERDLERLKVIFEIGLCAAYPDEETVERVARRLFDEMFDDMGRSECKDLARAALSALAPTQR